MNNMWQGNEVILPRYQFSPYKACSSHQVLDRFSFGRDAQPLEQSKCKDDITITIMDNTEDSTGGEEGSVPGGGSHFHEDLTSHGSGVMPVPNFTTLPEKGWEGRREAGMPWAGGPDDQLCIGKEERRERRRSQKFMQLCNIFEGGTSGRDDGQSGQSEGRLLQSEDTVNLSEISKIKGKENLQLKTHTFSSLRAIWEPKVDITARRQTFVQRKIKLTSDGLSLVKTLTNKRKGGNQINGSAGKRSRPGCE